MEPERLHDPTQKLETILTEFEQGWHADHHRTLDDWIRERASDLPAASKLWLTEEIVKIDLELGWRSGQARTLEHYAAVLPQYSVDLLKEEYRVRHRWGDQPDVDEYVNRFGAVGGEFAASTAKKSRLAATHAASGSTPAAERPFPPNTGRYRIIRPIGEGAFARVFLARDPTLNRHVALKIPKVTFQGVEEALLAASAAHPAFVTIYDVIEEQGEAIIVMEYINGCTFDEWCVSPAFDLKQGVQSIEGIAMALHHVHQLGLVHCDVKPSNILVDSQGVPKITDFGLAISRQSQGSLGQDELLGTPAFMSPEQVRGETKWLDARTDTWSLGVMLYQMVTKRLPFDGQNLGLLFDQILYHEPLRKEQQQPLEAAVLEVSLSCLAKEVWNRPDCGELAERLRQARESQSAIETRTDDVPGPTSYLGWPEVDFFVGREEELDTALEILRGDASLLTIHGPGGIGKTTFASLLAQQLAPEFNRCYFVSVSHGRDLDSLQEAVRSALGIESDGCDNLNIVERLRTGTCLVVLDNFEQLSVEATTQLEEWARALPHTKWIVTSRRRLKLRRERIVALGPLRSGTSSPAAADAMSESLQLFEAHARRVAPDFDLSTQRSIVEQICTRLDGIPLAIELAASRLDVLDPQQILTRLDEASFLASDELAVDARHRTLQSAVQWSLDLLQPPELEALLFFCLLPSGCSFDVAEPMIATVHSSPLACIQELVSQSLLRTSRRAHGKLISAFRCVADVVTHSADASQVERSWTSIAKILLEHCQRLADEIDHCPTKVAVERLLAERENLAAMRTWATRHGHLDTAAQAGLLIAKPLRTRGMISDEQLVLQRVEVPSSPVLQVELALCTSQNALSRGELEVAESHLAEAVELVERHGLTDLAARCELAEGAILVAAKNWKSAEPLFRRLSQQVSLPSHERCAVWTSLARIHDNLGDVELADQAFTKALGLAEQADHPLLKARILRHRANMWLRHSRLEEAQASLTQAQQISRDADLESENHLSLTSLGIVACEQGDFGKAVQLFDQAREIAARIGATRSVAVNEGNRGVALAGGGDQVAAIQCLRAAEELNLRLGNAAAGALNRLNRGLSVGVLGDLVEAQELVHSAMETLEQCQDRANAAIARGDLGVIARLAGQQEQAVAELQQAWTEFCELGIERSGQAAAAVISLAELLPAEEIDPRHAQTLVGLHGMGERLSPHLIADSLPERVRALVATLNLIN